MQEITELEKKKMDVLQEVAKTNVLLAGAQAELLQLKADKEKFFAFRENEVLGRIHTLLNKSRTLLSEANSNITLVSSFHQELKTFADFLHKAHEQFLLNVKDFDERFESDRKELEKQLEEASRIEARNKAESDAIEKEKEYLKERRKEVANDMRRLNDRRQAIIRTMGRLKK